MKLRGEIFELKHEGDTALVTLGNVRRKSAGGCSPYNPGVSIRVPLSLVRHYRIGRSVSLSVSLL